MADRYLIVNADDFGMNEATNKAVIELYALGRITSASILVTAPFAKQAVSHAKENDLSAGIHWALNSDWQGANAWPSAAKTDTVPSLLDENGRLSPDLSTFAKRAKSEQVTKELIAQTDMLLQSGFVPAQADNHCGTLYGFGGRMFFINALKLCRAYNLPFRLPKGDNFLQRQFPGGAPFAIKAVFGFANNYAKKLGVNLIDDMFSCPQKAEEIAIYKNLESWYIKEIISIKPGITEFFSHPALADPRSEALTDQWQKRVWEHQFLKSDAFMRTIEKEGIQLVSYKTAPFAKFKQI